MKIKLHLIIILFFAFGFNLSSTGINIFPSAHATTESQIQSAKDFMSSITGEALGFLQSEEYDLPTRAAKLRDLIVVHADIDRISNFLLGRYKRKATPEEFERFKGAMVDYIVFAYTKRLSSFKGVSLEVVRGFSNGDDDVTVATSAEQTGTTPVIIHWRLYDNGAGNWKLIDIVVEGLSMTVTQRDEFSSVIKSSKGKIGPFVDKLEKQVERLKKKYY